MTEAVAPQRRSKWRRWIGLAVAVAGRGEGGARAWDAVVQALGCLGGEDEVRPAGVRLA